MVDVIYSVFRRLRASFVVIVFVLFVFLGSIEVQPKKPVEGKEATGPLNLDDLVMDKAEVPVILVFTILLVCSTFLFFLIIQR